jgi:ribonuclease BN (tRNA processing enzyme)
VAGVRLTVGGGCGAWPAAGGACGGYLLEHAGFRLLIDPGYASLPRVLASVDAGDIDAILISHGHPDHCADLHPLVRARVYAADPPAPLPVHAPPGAVEAVMALDRPGALDDAYECREFRAGDRFEIGPFRVDTWLLPHFVPNAGLRLTAGGRCLAYTGDTGPSPDLVALARDADLYLAEATYPEVVPGRFEGMLSTARQAGADAARAGVGRLLLTHLWPGTSAEAALEAARAAYAGPIDVARSGLVIDIG